MDRDLQKKLDINSNIWVEANAGSGKTTYLIKRYLSLILKEGDLNKILCLSYTNIACREIEGRILQEIKHLINLYEDYQKIGEFDQKNEFFQKIQDIFTLDVNEIGRKIFNFQNNLNLNDFAKLLYDRVQKILENIKTGKDYFRINTIHSFCYNEIILKTENQNKEIFTKKDEFFLVKRLKNNLLSLKEENTDFLNSLDVIFQKKNSKIIFDEIINFTIKNFLSLEKKNLIFNSILEEEKFNLLKETNYIIYHKYRAFLKDINIKYLILNINNHIVQYLIYHINLISLIINNLSKNLTHIKNGNLLLCIEKISKFSTNEAESFDINFIMKIFFETFFIEEVEQKIDNITDKIYNIYLKNINLKENLQLSIEEALKMQDQEFIKDFCHLKKSILSLVDKKFEKEKVEINDFFANFLFLFAIHSKINDSCILYHYNIIIVHIVKEFRYFLQQESLITFDEILDLSNDILKDENSIKSYELDKNLKHILLDEAQDFNQVSWEIVDKISKEFFYGYSSFDADFRTIFCVGDGKQSIFSFQGSMPEYFYLYENYFREKSIQNDINFINKTLDISYRCSYNILNIIDNICNKNYYNSAFFSKKVLHLGQKEKYNIFIIQEMDVKGLFKYFLDKNFEDEIQIQDKNDWMNKNLKINFNPASNSNNLGVGHFTIDDNDTDPNFFNFHFIEGQINKFISTNKGVSGQKTIGILFRKKNIQNNTFYKCFDFLKDRNFNVEISSSDYISIYEMDIFIILSLLEGDLDKFNIIAILKNEIFNLSDKDIRKFSNKKDILKYILEYNSLDYNLNTVFNIFKLLYNKNIIKANFINKILHIFSFLENCFNLKYISEKIYTKYKNSLYNIFNIIYEQLYTLKINNVKDLKDYLQFFFKQDKANKSENTCNEQFNGCKVVLSTIHSAKGTEYDEVYIFDDTSNKKHEILSLDKDNIEITFTNDRYLDTEFDEEMRLFYVAITRSRGDVYIIKKNIIEEKNIEQIFNFNLNNKEQFIQILKEFYNNSLISNIRYDNLSNIDLDLNIKIQLINILNKKISYLQKAIQISAIENKSYFNKDSDDLKEDFSFENKKLPPYSKILEDI